MEPLAERIAAIFAPALKACGQIPAGEARELSARISHGLEQLRRPMRVAFIGRTSAGKSTMMNAFLGEHIAPTGDDEVTRNVSWFRYGDQPSLRVHLLDGTVAEEDFGTLANLAAHCEHRPEFTRNIRFIEAFRPYPVLRHFDLIDTPGFSTPTEVDQKTRNLLANPETKPDALVFLFSGTLTVPEMEEMESFGRANGNIMTGLTAVAVLTKFDDAPVWENAFDDANRMIQSILGSHAAARRTFYAMIPAIGAAGFGAQVLSEDDVESLRQLADLPASKRDRVLRSGRDYPGEAIPTALERERLFQRFGRFGILLALQHLGAGGTPQSLKEVMAERSNVPFLREVIVRHFGSRAELIKASAALSGVRDAAFRLSHVEGPVRSTARILTAAIDDLIANELRFREFTLLEQYYRGQLDFSAAELRQLLDLTGEHGRSHASRLGQPEDTPNDRLIALAAASQQYWRSATHRPFASIDSQEAARVLAESFGALHQELVAAGDRRKEPRT